MTIKEAIRIADDEYVIRGWTRDLREFNHLPAAFEGDGHRNHKDALPFNRANFSWPTWIAYKAIRQAIEMELLSPEVITYLDSLSAWDMCSWIATVAYYSDTVTIHDAISYLLHSEFLVRCATQWATQMSLTVTYRLHKLLTS